MGAHPSLRTYSPSQSWPPSWLPVWGSPKLEFISLETHETGRTYILTRTRTFLNVELDHHASPNFYITLRRTSVYRPCLHHIHLTTLHSSSLFSIDPSSSSSSNQKRTFHPNSSLCWHLILLGDSYLLHVPMKKYPSSVNGQTIVISQKWKQVGGASRLLDPWISVRVFSSQVPIPLPNVQELTRQWPFWRYHRSHVQIHHSFESSGCSCFRNIHLVRTPKILYFPLPSSLIEWGWLQEHGLHFSTERKDIRGCERAHEGWVDILNIVPLVRFCRIPHNRLERKTNKKARRSARCSRWAWAWQTLGPHSSVVEREIPALRFLKVIRSIRVGVMFLFLQTP